MRRIACVLLVLSLGTAGGALVAQANGGDTNRNAAETQYLHKPGCGPDKTDGVAGKSGRHEGQPPKAPDRQDCPNPPGQQ